MYCFSCRACTLFCSLTLSDTDPSDTVYRQQVKVWNTLSGFCFVTFVEHTAAVSGVAFTQSGKAILSSSLDGTVRAFDLTRYVCVPMWQVSLGVLGDVGGGRQ